MKTAGLFICMAICAQMFAVTHYVDFVDGSDAYAGTSKAAPWKLAPGMKGFAGRYTHKAGDQFIFKGGVTWPKSVLPLKILYSGAPGAVDVYGGEDLTWYAGEFWSQPVFDGQQLSGSGGWLIGDNGKLRSFVKMDNLFVRNSGNAETGEHDGANGAATLTDATKNWTSNRWVNHYLYNTTDGSHCKVTASTTMTATCTLAGGTKNAWSMGDAYVITDSSGTAIAFGGGGSNIEISHCTLQPQSVQSFSYANSNTPAGTVSSHILFHDNDISSQGRFVIYGYAGRVLDDVEVYHNRVQGKGAYNPGGYHMDGLMIGNPIYSSDPAQVATVTHISFHDNYFYGSWPGGATAMYFACSNTNYTEIFNNVFALETTDSNVGYIMRWQHHDGNISIYNNTFSSDAHPGAHAGATGVMIIADTYQPHHYGTLSIKNNILSGFGIDISGITISDWDSIDIDYNLHHISTAHGYGYPVWVGSKACKTLACAQSTWGYEMHSPAMGAPKFVAVPNGTAGSGDFHLLPSSPAIGTGINLSSVFTTDAAGRPRPSTGPWDMGAYVEGSNQPRPVISGQPALQNKH